MNDVTLNFKYVWEKRQWIYFPATWLQQCEPCQDTICDCADMEFDSILRSVLIIIHIGS